MPPGWWWPMPFFGLLMMPVILREWGGIGSPGRVRDDHHPDDQAAIAAAARLERSKRRRGYA